MISKIFIALVAYLIGSISFSIIFSKKIAGFDVRKKGSGNAGTTNVLRSVGVKAAVLTLICDLLKGSVAIWVAALLGKMLGANVTEATVLVQIAGLAVIIGHTFPVFFDFKGGKGVATALGVVLAINFKIGLVCLLVGVVVIALTRMVSAGSISAAIIYPILTIVLANNTSSITEGNYLMFSLLVACFLVFNHRSNIKRIASGKENKLSFKKHENNLEENKEKVEDKKEDKQEKNKEE